MKTTRLWRERPLSRLAGVVFLGTCFWWAGPVAGGTLYVSPVGTNDTVNKYPNWAGAATNLIWAVNAATNGDTVYVTNATYTLTNEVVVTNGITIQGYGGQATINGGYTGGVSGVRCFYLNHTNAVLDTLAITRGYAPNGSRSGYGGGVNIGNGGTIQNCLVFSNYAYGGVNGGYGGGIYIATTGNVFSCLIVSNNVRYVSATGGGVGIYLVNGLVRNCTNAYQGWGWAGGGMYMTGGRVENCQLGPGNNAPYGGGIYVNGGVVSNCVITNNLGSYADNQGGGGVFLAAGTVQNCLIVSNGAAYSSSGGAVGPYGCGVRMSGGLLLDSTITLNYGYVYPAGYTCEGGGGVYISGGVISNCIISYNLLIWDGYSEGGGGVMYTASAAIRNCLIVGNQAPRQGAGVYNKSGGGSLENCTIVGNSATRSPYDSGVYGGSVTNCIIVSNMTVDLTGVTGGYSCSTSLTHGVNGNITNAPQFVNWGSGYGLTHVMGNYRLTPASPCINAGFNQLWMTGAVDLDGRRRVDVFSGRVDMGAYEFLPCGVMFMCR